jgi:hypothetical protein
MPEYHHGQNTFNFYRLVILPDVMGGVCGTHGRGEKSIQVLGGKTRRKETNRKTEE